MSSRRWGRRKYLSGNSVDTGPQSQIYVLFIVHGNGTTRVKGLYRGFPGRRKNTKTVPADVMSPPWTRDDPQRSRSTEA